MENTFYPYDNTLWQNYLASKFGDLIPTSFVIDLGEIDFPIPPLLGTTSESIKAIQKHNTKKAIF